MLFPNRLPLPDAVPGSAMVLCLRDLCGFLLTGFRASLLPDGKRRPFGLSADADESPDPSAHRIGTPANARLRALLRFDSAPDLFQRAAQSTDCAGGVRLTELHPAGLGASHHCSGPRAGQPGRFIVHGTHPLSALAFRIRRPPVSRPLRASLQERPRRMRVFSLAPALF